MPFVHSQVTEVLYNIEQEQHPKGVLLKVAFGEPSSNDKIVRELPKTLEGLGLTGGKLALVTGPASLPVAMVLAHYLAHLFAAVGVFDPKLQRFVISISHDPELRVGDVL